MFTAQQTLDDASGDDVVFDLVYQNGFESRRINAVTTLALPEYLTIKHTSSGSGLSAVDRHLVQLAVSVDADPQPVTAIFNFTLQIPRVAEVTSAIVNDAVAKLIDFIVAGGLATPMSTTNVDKLLKNES
jgi:hypothetical protein